MSATSKKYATSTISQTAKLRILLITQGFYYDGGASVYAYELAKSLANRGIEVHVMCPGAKTGLEKIHPNIIIHTHRAIRLPLLFVPSHHFQVYLRSKKLVKKYKISTIHSNNNAGAFAYKNVPTIVTIHHSAADEVKQHKSRLQRFIYSADIFFEKKTINSASVIITDSHVVKESLQKIALNKPIQVLPCGVDLSFFRNTPALTTRKKLGVRPNELLLFFPGGSRSKRKGALDLFSALREMNNQNYRCVISGDPRNDIGWSQDFRKSLKNSGLEDKFILLGEINFSELPEYYSAADIVVYPSTLEGFGLPALEAVACGRPFIGTRTGEMPYIIKNGHNGVLVDTNSPHQLRTALERLMSRESERKKLADNARKSVMRYSWAALGKEVTDLHMRATQEMSE